VQPLEQAVPPEERFPLVIADPPYLRTGDVGRFPDDPRLAIDGGPDGMAVVRSCLAVAARHLGPGGALVLQVAGPAQADAVEALVEVSSATGLRPGARRVVDAERAILLLHRADA
jgi:release factor glutamine methyltransferase